MTGHGKKGPAFLGNLEFEGVGESAEIIAVARKKGINNVSASAQQGGPNRRCLDAVNELERDRADFLVAFQKVDRTGD